ncbi:exodeoxyribonuclease V subunit alpha [Buchnera aphidicola]|uniref:RecBCD enzyme subunit RecD n=1 Tax=Buchnera aphidicola (Artemisaphis artemisicola) TaxID=1241836 RepID=A0A4D6XFM0_9GAMM|nr:exodeoxyribonuclease V subunit alpha [Buchnera aphidicola]QCI16116.1 exodeoxyribonuclease V subunit alpha [Buchnera aphidicola (Artemisaphis artemisicola)]
MINLLKEALKKKIINPIDFYFSQLIAKKNAIIMLVASCISYETRHGHIFLPIEYFQKQYFFSNFNEKFTKKIRVFLEIKIDWLDELLKHPSISNGVIFTPLILSDNKIYLYKMWKAEKNIFDILYKKNKIQNINKKKYCKILNNLFPKKEDDSQKIAVALTLINKITFIVGSPGTGKTTTIIKIIIALIKQSKKTIKIQLSAPTGKATTRLTNIIQNNIFNIYLSDEEKNYLPNHAVTIHKLLGIQKISQKSFFNQNNLLNFDVLIIDETSMIDILMMEKIFLAVPKNIKLIFIGDHNQLCPVESGSILKNICNYANHGYSLKTISFLEKLTEYKFSKNININKKNSISNNICILQKNYRFSKNSGIYILSNAVKNKNIEIIKELFNNSINNVYFDEINSDQEYKNMIENISLKYKKFWHAIYQKKIKEIIEIFQYHQVLCILRDGIFGVNFLNKQIEENMYKKNIIKYFFINNERWYIGKPIMINKNSEFLELFNGNIGIANFSEKGVFQVSFLKENKKIRNIPVSILKNYETAWAMTVHKAQGSEFTNTSLILPNYECNLLNQDILYTGITRSRKQINIFSNKNIFMKTVLKNKNTKY